MLDESISNKLYQSIQPLCPNHISSGTEVTDTWKWVITEEVFSDCVFLSPKQTTVVWLPIKQKTQRRLNPRNDFFQMNCIWRHKNMILKFLLTLEFLSNFSATKTHQNKSKRLSLFQRRLSLPFSPCGQKQIWREGQSEILESWNMHKNPTIPNNPCFIAQI